MVDGESEPPTSWVDWCLVAVLVTVLIACPTYIVLVNDTPGDMSGDTESVAIEDVEYSVDENWLTYINPRHTIYLNRDHEFSGHALILINQKTGERVDTAYIRAGEQTATLKPDRVEGNYRLQLMNESTRVDSVEYTID